MTASAAQRASILDADQIATNLWQGAAPPDGSVVADAGFTSLFLCAKQLQPPDSAFPGVNVYRVMLDDSGVPPTKQELVDAAAAGRKLALLLKVGEKVLVTCHLGINRSGLVSALGLHYLTGMSGPMTVATVQARRPNALYNRWFREILYQLPQGGF